MGGPLYEGSDLLWKALSELEECSQVGDIEEEYVTLLSLERQCCMITKTGRVHTILQLPCVVDGVDYDSLVDTGATLSVANAKLVPPHLQTRGRQVGVRVASGHTVYSDTWAEITVNIGSHSFIVEVLLIPTTSFSVVLGMDFLQGNSLIKRMEFHPFRIVVGNSLFEESVALTKDQVVEVQRKCLEDLRVIEGEPFESYKLLPHLKHDATQALAIQDVDVAGNQVQRDCCDIDLFASGLNNNEPYFCDQLHDAY